MANFRLRGVLALAILSGLAALPAAAQAPADARPSIRAERLQDGEHLKLDARLDEPAWQRAVPVTEFRQKDPVPGAAPTQQTEIHVLFDADNLYIGAIFHDTEPDRVLGLQRERDGRMPTDDRFLWILDTFADGRTGYYFEINPAGLMGDALIVPGGGINQSWNGIWEARVERGDFGWAAEIRIPFRTLNFNPELDAWGINFQRTIRRINEEISWSGHLRNQAITSPIHAGRLVGLSGMTQGLGLEVKPFLTSARHIRTGAPSSSEVEFGVDASYNLTPSLRASLTLNTDFAEVEVDQRQVNLTRFAISYPERRDFFLEGSGVFSFAPRSGVQPFFSRRIGLVGGIPIPIVYGARLAGQVGPNDLGLYHVRTASQDSTPAEDFTAARAVRNFLRESTVGALYVRRATDDVGPGGGGFDQHTLGSDMDLTTSSFLSDQNLSLQLFAVGHTRGVRDDSTAVGDRAALGARLTFPNEPWYFHAAYEQLGSDYNPAVGFTPRRAFRRFQPSFRYSPRLPSKPWLRQLDFVLDYEYLTDLDNRVQTIGLDATLLQVVWRTNDMVSFGGVHTQENLDAAFQIFPGVVVPAGQYSFNEWRINGRGTGKRPVWGTWRVQGGQFWSGERLQTMIDGNVRVLPSLTFGTVWERNEVDLKEGEFSADLYRVVGAWLPNPWTSLTANVQYDDVSKLVGFYGRLRWIVRPGNDLFIVYTHNWLHSDERTMTLNRSGITKLTYTHRF